MRGHDPGRRVVDTVAGVVLWRSGATTCFARTDPKPSNRRSTPCSRNCAAAQRTVAMFELPLPPFNNRYGDAQRRIAKRHGVLLVPKRVLIGILTSEGATVDSIHLSRRGHELMAETVWGIIGRVIRPK